MKWVRLSIKISFGNGHVNWHSSFEASPWLQILPQLFSEVLTPPSLLNSLQISRNLPSMHHHNIKSKETSNRYHKNTQNQRHTLNHETQTRLTTRNLLTPWIQTHHWLLCCRILREPSCDITVKIFILLLKNSSSQHQRHEETHWFLERLLVPQIQHKFFQHKKALTE